MGAITWFPGNSKPGSISKRPAWSSPIFHPFPPSSSIVTIIWPTRALRRWFNSDSSKWLQKEAMHWARSPSPSHDAPIHSVFHAYTPNWMGTQDRCCGCHARSPPGGAGPGRGLPSLHRSSCAPLIPTAHSALQFSPLFLPRTD